MSVLAIETTGEAATAALLDDSGKLFLETGAGRMDHLHGLIPMVKLLTEQSGTGLADVEMIAVSMGPGSFTGIRIGVAAARTLAQVLGVPVAPVMTLDSFVYNEFQTDTEFSGQTLIVPMIDARRNQVYASAYLEGGMDQQVTAGAYDVKEFLELVSRRAADGISRIIFCGDGAEAYADAVAAADLGGAVKVFAEGEASVQNAAAVLKAGLILREKGGLCGYNEAAPVYFRKAEAEQKRESGKLGLKKRMKKESGPVLELPPTDGEIVYRMIGMDQIDALTALDSLCFTRPWNRAAFESDLQGSRKSAYAGAFNSRGELIGFAGLVYLFDEGDINRVAVHPLYRAKGIGGRCLDMAMSAGSENGVRKVLLEVREANRSAISLYKDHGFRVISKRKGYYAETGENALIMQKEQQP